MAQDMTAQLVKAALKYMRESCRLVDAANARAKYEAGSKRLKQSNEAYQKQEARFDIAYAELDVIVEKLQ